MELFEEAAEGGNTPEFSVSELSGAVKRVIEGEFGHVRVRGELGRVSRPRSGHVYLDLKDDRAVLNGVIWKGVVRGLEVQPEEGMEVIATGRLTTFPGNSRYQIVIEHLAPAGVGALMAMLEKRKKALEAEGLFRPDRKRPLPFLPEVIGVVTSPSGAVIRDILHRLADRFPRRVLLWPVPVQGEKCAASVAAAIQGFNALPKGGAMPRPDVLIVARGGGSVEDLWGFNDEAVVRAVAASDIPVISAVGHETDTTLIDLVADQRAPTPTAAAEMAVPVRLELLTTLSSLEERRRGAMARGLMLRGQRLRDVARALPRPEALVAERAQRLDGLSLRLPRALVALVRDRDLQLSRGPAGRFGPQLLAQGVERQRQRLMRAEAGLRPQVMASLLERLSERLGTRAERLGRAGEQYVKAQRGRYDVLARTLATLGPQSVLARGFAIVRDGDGAVLTGAGPAEGAAALEIEFADGRIRAVPDGGDPAPRKRATRKKKEPEQGTLF
ncbi:exodeoxyribonuclease VII large subunit [Amaricoccus macauensis]|uniref:exodeoxyribonuclease VII large subunit n=1 Tax=Amaricoccus macauensis TaxID=57001 RepID=UPI003C7A42C7